MTRIEHNFAHRKKDLVLLAFLNINEELGFSCHCVGDSAQQKRKRLASVSKNICYKELVNEIV